MSIDNDIYVCVSLKNLGRILLTETALRVHQMGLSRHW